MPTSKLADLNNIRYLLAVADRGSFSAAARLFGVPVSLVSRKIARLEVEVGARLFQRTTRSVKLTDAGQTFLRHARVGMQSFALAHELLGDRQGTPSGRVRLSAPAGIANTLWPIISRFLKQHPGVHVEMEFADRYVDLVEERFDLAIRSGPGNRFERLIGRRLVDVQRCLFASPAYLKLHGTPRTVADLKKHTCVILGTGAERAAWNIHIGRRRQSVIVGGRVSASEAGVAAECAADGFGIAFLPLPVCVAQLAAGRLKRVLPRASGGDMALWLVYPDRHLPAASRVLAELLVNELPTSFVASGGK